jgi:predicted nucleic acid-binding protein
LKNSVAEIKSKFSEAELIRFYQEIASLNLEIAEPATEEDIEEYAQIVEQKDTHVLATATKSYASILLTIDRKHFMTPAIKQAELPIAIFTPGEFLRHICETA